MLLTQKSMKNIEFNVPQSRETLRSGEYIEKPAIEYIKKNLSTYEDGFVNVNINFYDSNNKLLNKGSIRDIDGLILNNNTGKFEKIKSCKLPINATKKQTEIDIIQSYGNIPLNNIDEIRSFLNNNETLKNIVSKKIKDNVVSFNFEMINVKTKQKTIMDAAVFQQKVKTGYNFSEVIEINPNTFETTGNEIIEGTYQYLFKKYNQTN
jgi:hypothetical protein